MKKFIQSLTGGYTSSAKVVDGKLILSFPDAIRPILWQMDISQARTSAREVEHDESSGEYALVLKTPKGERHKIAPFDSRAKAVRGLMAVSAAMESGQGRMRPASEAALSEGSPASSQPRAAANDTRPGGGLRWAAGIAAILLVVFLATLWGEMSPRPPAGMPGTPGAPVSKASAPVKASESAGVPVSAEEFLKGR